MSQEQYDREKAAGRIDVNAIYLTPDEGGNSGGSVVPDEEFFNWLVEAKIIEPAVSASGKIYTTNNNKIYVL
jgi:hypothetical protein